MKLIDPPRQYSMVGQAYSLLVTNVHVLFHHLISSLESRLSTLAARKSDFQVRHFPN